MFRNTLNLLTLALLAGAPVLAQTESTRLDPVDVRGGRTAPRFDVSNACPSYAGTLQDGLQGRLPDVHEVMEKRVHFSLEGGSVRDIALPGMPYEYRRHIRQAVRGMQCAADGKANQRYSFLLVLLPEGQAGGAQLAVRELEPTTLAAAQPQ